MFDMLYTEPSVYGEEDDLKFARAQEKSENVIQTVFKQDSNEVLFPIEPIKNTSALLANVTSSLDSDDVLRKYKPVSVIDGVAYPILGLAPLYLEYDSKVNLPPMDKDGYVKLRFLESIDRYTPYSAKEILESYDLWINGKESFYLPEDFSGYAFFGLYAPGLFDICSTPVSQVYPGVGVHITALDNYLQNNYIYDAAEKGTGLGLAPGAGCHSAHHLIRFGARLRGF